MKWHRVEEDWSSVYQHICRRNLGGVTWEKHSISSEKGMIEKVTEDDRKSDREKSEKD